MRKRFPWWATVTLVLLAGVASLAMYNIILQGSEDLLTHWGIENYYIQNAIVIGAVTIIFAGLGFGFRKTIKRIFA